MISTLRSVWVWVTTVSLTTAWLPLIAMMRLFDSDPVRCRTETWFRRLFLAITKLNLSWRVLISGELIPDGHPPYVVVSNHQSMGDIPLLCHLPWSMKWIAKAELFTIPIFGWMMRMAGHIPLARDNLIGGAHALLLAENYLKQKCSVMIFPEGTRSLDGRVYAFTEGAFHLAIKAKVAILPVAVEGSYKCLPDYKVSSDEPKEMFLKIFSPISTSSITSHDITAIKESVRQMIIEQVAEWRGIDPQKVDGLLGHRKSQ